MYMSFVVGQISSKVVLAISRCRQNDTSPHLGRVAGQSVSLYGAFMVSSPGSVVLPVLIERNHS